MAVLMSLGSILFYRPYLGQDGLGFETVSRKQAATLPAQQRLSRDNAIQFTGPGEETITIHGRAFPYHFGGVSTLQSLGDALRAGQPLMLMQFNANLSNSTTVSVGGYYDGTRVGNYMIRELNKESVLFTSDGVPMKIDFTLDLVLYGDDLNTNNFSTPADTSNGSTGMSTSPTTPAPTSTNTTPSVDTETATPTTSGSVTTYRAWNSTPSTGSAPTTGTSTSN